MQPIVDPEDLPLLQSRAWKVHGKQASYFKARFGRSIYYLHRLIAGAGPGQIVDHINGDTLDCRRANLRLCDRSESNMNRRARKDSRAPYKGITETKSGRWLAQIMKAKQYHRIGLFDTPIEAATAYDTAAVRLHGAFAKTNGFVTHECSHAA